MLSEVKNLILVKKAEKYRSKVWKFTVEKIIWAEWILCFVQRNE